MPLIILTGDDEQQILEHKQKLLPDINYQKIDCAEEPEALLDLLRSPGLFVQVRKAWVVNFEALGDEKVAQVAQAAKSTSAIAVCRAASLSVKAKTLLKGKAEIISLSLPKGKMTGVRVSEMVHQSGLKIDPAGKKMLLERLGHDTDRIASIIKQCQMAGIKAPTYSQLLVLVGTAAAPGVPWDLGDAVERGQGQLALEANKDVTPLAVISYLANRIILMGKYAEAEDTASKEEAFKTIHKFQAQKLARLGDRLGVEGTKEAIKELAKFDLRVKVGADAANELDLLLVELSRIFSGEANRSL